MPILATARHVAWVACGVTGIITLSCCAAAVVWVFRAARSKPQPLPRRDPWCMLSESEFDAAVRALLEDTREP
jgi:hypothetical protein